MPGAYQLLDRTVQKMMRYLMHSPAARHGRHVPKLHLLDHLVGAQQKRLRNG
jgi:hypothetical protein